MLTVLLDGGHGGKDSGAVGVGNALEKTKTLDMVYRIKPLLERAGVKVALTRTDDTYVGINERVALANKLMPDILVSIHMNAFQGTARGCETLCHARDAKVDAIHHEVAAHFTKYGSLDRGVKPSNSGAHSSLGVLDSTRCKAVLLELGFIDNAQDLAIMTGDVKLNELAGAITKGILNALGVKQVETVPPVQTEVKTIDSQTANAIQALVNKGVISSPEYWKQNAVSGKLVKGEHVASLLQKLAQAVK